VARDFERAHDDIEACMNGEHEEIPDRFARVEPTYLESAY